VTFLLALASFAAGIAPLNLTFERPLSGAV